MTPFKIFELVIIVFMIVCLSFVLISTCLMFLCGEEQEVDEVIDSESLSDDESDDESEEELEAGGVEPSVYDSESSSDEAGKEIQIVIV